MKFFIDTANLAQIKEAQDLGVLDGVTTNPSLMAKEGISGEENVLAHYRAICEIVDGDVSAEVISTDFEGVEVQGRFQPVCFVLEGVAPACTALPCWALNRAPRSWPGGAVPPPSPCSQGAAARPRGAF